MRDPHQNKVGRNHACWCGSGIKYKNCHLDRAAQEPPHPIQMVSEVRKLEKGTTECSCRSDLKNCNAGFGRNHSISKSSSLSKISERGSVYLLLNSPHRDNKISAISLNSHFSKISHNEASTFRAFCNYHDNALFRNLDRGDTSDITKFLVQLFYRATCFELFRKRIALEIIPTLRVLDKGMSFEDQMHLQDRLTKDHYSHHAGWNLLDSLRTDLEPSTLEHANIELSYIHLKIPEVLGVAGFGCFQPSMDWQGNKIQTINQIQLIDGKAVKEKVDSVATYCLPLKDKTIIGLVCKKSDELALQFLQSFINSSTNIADAIIAALILHVENVYYRISFIDALSTKKRKIIISLYDSGMGVDMQSANIKEAKLLTLFDGKLNPKLIVSL